MYHVPWVEGRGPLRRQSLHGGHRREPDMAERLGRRADESRPAGRTADGFVRRVDLGRRGERDRVPRRDRRGRVPRGTPFPGLSAREIFGPGVPVVTAGTAPAGTPPPEPPPILPEKTVPPCHTPQLRRD